MSFFSKLFCLLLSVGTFTSVRKDKKSAENKVFINFFACLWKDPDTYKIITDPDPGGPKTYGSGTLMQT
jgi:hypothetical protein